MLVSETCPRCDVERIHGKQHAALIKRSLVAR
jgi:hypothetical protein